MNRVTMRKWLRAPLDVIVNDLTKARTLDDESMLEIRDRTISPALNKLTIMAWEMVENEMPAGFKDAVKELAKIYRLPSDLSVPHAAYVWEEVMKRVYILGGLAVEHGAYAQVPTLAKKEPNDDDYWRASLWARHCLTMLSRHKRLRGKSLCVMTLDFLQEAEYFVTLFGYGDSAIDRATNAVCQFDFLQCMITATSADSLEACYPSFGAYYRTRVEPLVVDLLRGGDSRAALAEATDNDVANLIQDLNAYAWREFRLTGWDGREWKESTVELIKQHATAKPIRQ